MEWAAKVSSGVAEGAAGEKQPRGVHGGICPVIDTYTVVPEYLALRRNDLSAYVRVGEGGPPSAWVVLAARDHGSNRVVLRGIGTDHACVAFLFSGRWCHISGVVTTRDRHSRFGPIAPSFVYSPITSTQRGPRSFFLLIN